MNGGEDAGVIKLLFRMTYGRYTMMVARWREKIQAWRE